MWWARAPWPLAMLAGVAVAWGTVASAAHAATAAAGRVSAGLLDTCVVLVDGSVRCFGYGGDGALGYGNANDVGVTDTPASAGAVNLGAGRTAMAVSAGSYHTCAIVNSGGVVCWGFGGDGRLGYANLSTVGLANTPATTGLVDLGSGRTATAVSAGADHTCAILDNGRVLCWGFGAYGELGYGNMLSEGSTETPGSAGPVALGTGRTATAISAGGDHTCVILDNGAVECWGVALDGQLGYGNVDNVGTATTPGQAGPVDLGTGSRAVAISAGGSHTCAILDDGGLLCWGYGGNGRLGYGNQIDVGDRQSPGSVGPVPLPAGHKAVAVSAGTNDTCVILDDGSVRCWGYGAYGQLGYGNTNDLGDTPTTTPDKVPAVNLGPGRSAVAISAGARHTCALLDDLSVRCWGSGAYGRLGYCGEKNVGDTPTNTPDTAGPVNLEPGDGGEPCPSATASPVNVSPPSISGQMIAGHVLTEAHGSWTPTAMGYGYQWERCNRAGADCGSITGATGQTYTLGRSDVGSTVRVLETARAGGAGGTSATSTHTAVIKAGFVANPDVTRKREFHDCLATVNSDSMHARALTRNGSKRHRAQARRRLARQLATGRARCVKDYGRTPGQVTGLRAVVRGRTKLELDFKAPGTNADKPPATTSYLVKQSLRPIGTQHDFSTAQALCNGACRFRMTQIGAKIALMITGLRPNTVYYYAIAALDNVTARPGPRTPTLETKTAT